MNAALVQQQIDRLEAIKNLLGTTMLIGVNEDDASILEQVSKIKMAIEKVEKEALSLIPIVAKNR